MAETLVQLKGLLPSSDMFCTSREKVSKRDRVMQSSGVSYAAKLVAKCSVHTEVMGDLQNCPRARVDCWYAASMSSVGFRPTPFRVRCAFLFQLLCTKVLQVPFSVHSCLPKMTTPMSECCHFNPRKRKCLWSCLITEPTHFCVVKAAKSFVANTNHASWLRVEGSCVTTVKRT